MNCAESNLTERDGQAPADAGVLQFPAGLLGFEQAKRYVLLGSREEAPFMWLQMLDEPRLAFLVIEPGYVVPDYAPEISDADVQALGLERAEDAWVLNIVTVHPDGRATVNLKGPVLINRRTLVARQVIPLNVSQYPLQHPLPAPEPVAA